jgi:hypothetical protein
MALRRQQPPAHEPCPCAGLAERLAGLEADIAALARTAIRAGLATDVCQLPGNRVIDNRADAAAIRAAAARQ